MILGFWQGLGIGLFVGIIIGFLLRAILTHQKIKSESTFAWILSSSWLIWHLSAALTTIERPPTVFDVVAGAAVGVVIGEKFFDYLAIMIGSIKK